MAEIATTVSEITTVNEPLLSPRQATVPAVSAGGNRTSTSVPMHLGLFASGRAASQPSLVVRENVAEQMEDWRVDWGYSFPVVVMDTLWNLVFVVVSVAMLFWIAREETDVKLRIWICGYSMQCLVHVVLMLLEYRRRNRRIDTAVTMPSLTSSSSSSVDDENHTTPIGCEMINTMFSYLWWTVGIICLTYSYNDKGTSRLFWLTLAFLAIDVFFVALRTVILLLLSAAYCFCLPCIIAFMYYTSRQERVSEANISNLPKYIFEVSNADVEQPDVQYRMMPRRTNGPDFSTERVLLSEDVDCCICLSQYEDGQQLHLLPCSHHFHSSCITKWLRMASTCPLCKSVVAVQ